MSTPRVSLLLPNRNNARVLQYVLDRLARNTTYPDVELVAIDDGSTDGSREILRSWRGPGEFRLIEQEHRGVIEALNAGLAAAAGELIVQLDADASVETPGWVERMVEFFLSDERIGVVTGKVVFDNGEIHTCGVNVVGAGGFYSRGAEITEPVGRRTYHERVLRYRDGERPELETIAEVDGGAGCCMMYRRDVALAVGGYDPGYSPVWFDDLDLTIAIRRHGLKVFYLPDVHVIHHVSHRSADEPGWRRQGRAVRKWIGAGFPPRVRRRISQALDLDLPPAPVRERLAHHYEYWRQKWGFEMLNPDMAAVVERWGATELCWSLDPEMRRAGEEIVAAFVAARPGDESVSGHGLRENPAPSGLLPEGQGSGGAVP